MISIYAETDNNQYLVNAKFASDAVVLLLKDVEDNGDRVKDLYSVFAIDDNVECKFIQDHIANLINEDSEK